MPARTSTDPGRALRWRVMPIVVTAALGACMLLPAPHAAAAGGGPVWEKPATAYVTVGGGVLPIDTATNTAGTPIPVPGADGVIPAPNGRTVYVTGSGGVTPIVTATDRTRPVIPLSGPVAVAPDSSTLYVGSGTSVVPVNAATDAMGTPIPVGGAVTGIVITPSGQTAYVAASTGVVPIDLATGTAGTLIPVGAPSAMAVTPDGGTVYAAWGRA